MLKLIIEDDEGRKTVVPFVRDEITIGRQEGNTIRLTERNVSRRHARLVRQNGHVLVEDLGSYNGVLINGERLQAPAQVGDGDLIQIGDYELALQKEAAQEAAAPFAPTVRMPASTLQAAMAEAPSQPASAETEADIPVHSDEDDASSAAAAEQRRHPSGLANETAAAKGGSKKPLPLALVGVALLVLGGSAAWFLFGQSPATSPHKPQKPIVADKQTQPVRPTTDTGSQPAVPAPIPQLTEKLQLARAAIDARDFDKAVDTLETLEDSAGQRPTVAEDLLTQARAEQQSKQNLDLAQQEFDAGRLEEAQKHLGLAEGTLAFAEEHTALKEKVEAALAEPPPQPAKSPTARTPAGNAGGTARRSAKEQARQLYNNGATLLRQRQYREAESVLKKCIALEASYAPCYFGMGAAKARLGQVDEGARYYSEFLRLAPNHEMAPAVKKTLDDYQKQKQPGGGK